MTAKRKKDETHLVEWEESWRDEYLKRLGGFANADGGTLIIGRNDRGEPVGAHSITESRPEARLHYDLLPRELSVDAVKREMEAVA